MTRGQLSRAAQEAQKIRNLYTAGISLAVVIVLVLGLAVVFTYVIRPNAEVANVNGTTIARAAYNKLRRWSLYQQIQQEVFQQQLGASTSTDTSTITSYQTQLKSVDSESTLDTTVLQQLVDNEVLRQKSAADFSINPTSDELLQRALQDFYPQPTPPSSSETPSPEATGTPTLSITYTPTATGTQTPSSTATPSSTPTAGSPTMTPTPTETYPPVPSASATATVGFGNFLQSIKEGPDPSSNNPYCPYGCPGFSESDYMNYIIEPQLRQEQVTDKLAATQIVTDVEQVRVQHILTNTLEGAQAIKARLDAGEDFGNLVLEQSSDTASNANLGVYDWFPRVGSGYVQPFVDASFSTPVGTYSDPVQTEYGYHIIKVLGKEVRPLTQTQIDSQKQQLYTDWFNEAKLSSTISPATFQAPTPTPPPLIEPTNPPSANPTPTVGTGTPGASPPVTDTNPITDTNGDQAPGVPTPTPPSAAEPTATDTPEPSATP